MLRLMILLAALITLHCHAQVVIKEATVRLLPAGLPNTSAYFTIENTGEQAVVLTAAKSPIAKRVEIHNHVMLGDSMHMEHLKEVIIQPSEVLRFSPGGLHLMLFDLVKPLVEGQLVVLSLITEKGQTIEFQATVAKP